VNRSLYIIILGAVIVNTISLVPLNGNGNKIIQYAIAADSVTVLLDGKTIPSRGFIHLYDSTPSGILIGHIAAHLPCDDLGVPSVELVGGVAPELSLLNMSMLAEISTLGSSCMYHADLPQKNQTITDVVITNPSEKNVTLPDTTSVVIHVSQFGKNDRMNNPNLAYNSFNTTSKKIISHIHPLLNVTVDGTPFVVPEGIGINSLLWNDHSLDNYGMGPMKMEMGGSSMIMQGMAPLHTHDASGTIHVESNEMRNFTLGHFLQNWGIDLLDKTVELIVDGNSVENYEGHKLADKEPMMLIIKNGKS
jgi:hypothetical protein